MIGQPAPSTESLGLGDLLRVHVVPFEEENIRALAAVSVAGPSYYLLRPDGHVGLAGTHGDEAALRRWFAQSHVRVEQARQA